MQAAAVIYILHLFLSNVIASLYVNIVLFVVCL